MRVSTAQLYDKSLTGMRSLGVKAESLQGQIATGKKVINASDDAGSYARLSSLKRDAATAKTEGANLDLATTLVAQSDSVLGAIETQLQRAKELAIQGNSGTLSAAQKRVIGESLNAIVDDLVSLANSKDARGQPLFGGATDVAPFARGADRRVTWQGEGVPAAIPVGEAGSIQATDSGERLFTGIAVPGGVTDIFAAVQMIADAFSAGSSAAEGGLDAVGAGLDQIGAARASFGARGARLELEAQRLDDLKLSREAERGGLEDADLDLAIVELQKTMTVLQATQASFTKLTQLSLFDYLR